MNPTYEQVLEMFEEEFEPHRYGSVRFSELAGIWSRYAEQHGIERGSAVVLNQHFSSVAKGKSRRSRRYGHALVSGVRRKQ